MEPVNGLGSMLRRSEWLSVKWQEFLGLTQTLTTQDSFSSAFTEVAVTPQQLQDQKLAFLEDIIRLHKPTQDTHHTIIQQYSPSGIPPHVWEAALCRSLANPAARFRFPSMISTLDQVANGSSDVLAIYPTGSGKSMLMILPVLFQPHHTTVILSNFRVLTGGLPALFYSKGIQATIWNHDVASENTARVIIAPMEAIENPEFLIFLRSLNTLGRLSRIVVDEAHTILTSISYRSVFRHLSSLRSAIGYEAVPLFLLTATCPPKWCDALIRLSGCRPQNTLIFRESSDRPNLRFRLLPRSALGSSLITFHQSVVQQITRLAQESLVDPISKGLVFFRTQSLATQFQRQIPATLFTSAVYTSAIEDKERDQRAKKWLDGETKILFCTSGFGQGVDDPNVRFVVIVEPPYNILDLAQQAGRAGRDGQPANVLLVPGLQVHQRVNSPPRPHGARMQDYLGVEGDLQADSCDLFETMHGCIRQQLSSHLDSGVDALDCFQRKESVLRCDACDAKTQQAQIALDAEAHYNHFYFSFDHTPGTLEAPVNTLPPFPSP